MQAVILAGGRGTRLSGVVRDIPKPMVPIGGMPVLEHQIRLLAAYGVKDIWLLVGHLAEIIERYFSDGSAWGVRLRYVVAGPELGTGGSLLAMADYLDEDFLLLYGDVLMNFDISRMVDFHAHRGSPALTVAVSANSYPYESDLFEIGEGSRVERLYSKPHPEHLLFHNNANVGVNIVSPKVFSYIRNMGATDFASGVIPKILESGEPVLAYKTPEYFKDMGTPLRLQEVTDDYERGVVHMHTLSRPRPAVFLDQDGVLMEDFGDALRPETAAFFPEAAEAVFRLNSAGFLVVIVTNQRRIAKGLVSIGDLDAIYRKLAGFLGKHRAKIDAVYMCPHGIDAAGNPTCPCRKPQAKLFLRAASDLHIDLAKSFLIGDMTTDAVAAANAGVAFVGVKTGHGVRDGRFPVASEFPLCENILKAAEYVISQYYDSD